MVQQQANSQWEFERVLNANRAALIASNDQTTSSLLSAAHAVVLAECALLKNTKCQACSGFGHTKRDCPTHKKLTNLGGNGGRAGVIIAGVRELIS